MPPDIVKARGESNIVWNFVRLVEDGVVSQEKLVTLLGDIYGSQYVTLRGPDGAAIFDSGNNIKTKMERQISLVSFTIPNGQSLSAEIDIGGASMGIIHMPGTWTAANLTFRIAPWSAGTFYNLYDENGSEVVVTAALGRAIPLPPEVVAAQYIKVRSGTSGTPVNQGAERQFRLLLKG